MLLAGVGRRRIYVLNCFVGKSLHSNFLNGRIWCLIGGFLLPFRDAGGPTAAKRNVFFLNFPLNQK
jgi:hypothetical protein